MTSIKKEGNVVPQSELDSLKKHIKQLERVLGKKTLENEILKEAVKLGREKNSSRGSPCQDWKISSKGNCSNFKCISL